MEKDLQEKEYLHAPERFADLINGVVCGGKKILRPSDLTEMDSQTGHLQASTRRGRWVPRRRPQYRDVIRKAAFGVNFMVIGIENQEEVHYLMPLRCMSYDASEYERQAAVVGRQVRRRKDITSAEFCRALPRIVDCIHVSHWCCTMERIGTGPQICTVSWILQIFPGTCGIRSMITESMFVRYGNLIRRMCFRRI